MALSLSLDKLKAFHSITELSTWEPLPIYPFHWTTDLQSTSYTCTFSWGTILSGSPESYSSKIWLTTTILSSWNSFVYKSLWLSTLHFTIYLSTVSSRGTHQVHHQTQHLSISLIGNHCYFNFINHLIHHNWPILGLELPLPTTKPQSNTITSGVNNYLQ